MILYNQGVIRLMLHSTEKKHIIITRPKPYKKSNDSFCGWPSPSHQYQSTSLSIYCLVVEPTHLKKIGPFPQVGRGGNKTQYLSCHHLVTYRYLWFMNKTSRSSVQSSTKTRNPSNHLIHFHSKFFRHGPEGQASEPPEPRKKPLLLSIEILVG